MAKNELRSSRESENRETTTRKKAWKRPEVLPNPTPERADVHPEIFTDSVADNRFKDNIIIGGLMLCKAPEEMVAERNEYYKQQTDSQMQSVDQNLMRESDPRMPMFNDRKSTVSFGKS